MVWDDKKRAVFLKTNVTELPESEKEAAMAAYKEKLADFMPRCQNPQIYVAPIGELDEKLQRAIGCILLHKHYI